MPFTLKLKKKFVPQIAEENARWGADTYFYSLEPGACSEKKSLYYLEAIGDSPKPFYTNVGMVWLTRKKNQFLYYSIF